jgi:hypothetical protein
MSPYLVSENVTPRADVQPVSHTTVETKSGGTLPPRSCVKRALMRSFLVIAFGIGRLFPVFILWFFRRKLLSGA